MVQNSKSYDGPAIKAQKRIREDMAPYVPARMQQKSLHPSMQVDNTLKELSLQDKIRLMNEANSKKLAVQPSLQIGQFLDRKQAALPPVLPLRKSHDAQVGPSRGLPPVQGNLNSSVPKKAHHMIQPPEWWG